MAQAKPEISKSDIIRDFVTKNPTLTISEVAAALAKQGTTVSKNLVYVVKGKMKAKKHKEQREKAEAKVAAKESQAKETSASSDGAAKGPSKSSAVRAVLKGNRKMMAKDVVSALAEKGISVTEGLVYFVKGQMKGRKKKKASQVVAQVAATTVPTTPVLSDGDAVKTILKVKGWAAEIGGMKKLKALVEALSE